ncbi:MAG: alpha/beta fold hydrolase [Thermodesulfobacteriota bacterium]
MTGTHTGTVKVNGIDLYYEIHGAGEPLVLIEGLGYSAWMWYKQIPAFSERYRVIVFDNRGAGNTDKPDTEYSTEIMADDASGLLRTLGIDQAHVLGVSLGGFIAQELALRHPDLVKSLVLVSTNSGSGKPIGRNSHPWNGFLTFWGFLPGLFEMSGKTGIPPSVEYVLKKEARIRYGLSLAFTPEYIKDHPDEIERIVKWRLDNPQPGYAWTRQMMAGKKFDSAARAGEIKAPAVVICGTEDKIVSPESAFVLAERIPDSRFVPIEGSGHLLFIERSEEFNEAVLGFLDEVCWENQKTASGKIENSGWWEKVISFFSDSDIKNGNAMKN